MERTHFFWFVIQKAKGWINMPIALPFIEQHFCDDQGADDLGKLLNSHENRDTISPAEKEMMATMTSMET